MKPYGILSDQHCHSWSQFATTRPDGLNSRLAIILDEMERAAEEVKAAGGDTLFFAGDLFHVRGSLDPEVFNPTYERIETILKGGVNIFAIPGNHDLKGKETSELGNAMQTLDKLDGFSVFTTPMCRNDPAFGMVLMVPWCSSVEALGAKLAKAAKDLGESLKDTDLIIHAPVNGVLMGIPDHGFYAADLAKYGFRRVFSGHYHNHMDFENGVYSIGATCHQTWSDIGTRAGFLLVDQDKVTFRASRAPKFVEITSETPEDDIPLIVDGNYVRVRFETVTSAQALELREGLTEMGAAGVVIQATKAAAVTRSGSTVKTGASLEASVANYVATLKHDREAELNAMCADILSRARSTASASAEA